MTKPDEAKSKPPQKRPTQQLPADDRDLESGEGGTFEIPVKPSAPDD